MDVLRAARAAVVSVLVLVAACAPAAGAVPVPTFPADPPPTSAPAAAERRPIADCVDVLPPDQMPALLALPVDSVRVQTVVDRPAPAVGRVSRMRCVYSVVDRSAPPTGPAVTITIGTFRDAGSARDQHERNVADQGSGADGRARPELGAAAATVLQQAAVTSLLTALGPVTVDLDVVRRPLPLAPEDLLVDLARRVWAQVAASTGTGPGAV